MGGSLADKPATERQRRILQAITEFTSERGYPPSVREIGERVGLSSSSTIHAHLKALEKRGMITRHRQTDDRRVVKTRITPKGLDLLKTLDEPVHELHKRQFRHMSPSRLKDLEELLDELRKENPPSD
jgi:DNA-binding MarR family transcriptional regulator